MMKLKQVAAAAFAASVVILSPVAAYADCSTCQASCDSAFPDDGTEAAAAGYLSCVLGCFDSGTGAPCQICPRG